MAAALRAVHLGACHAVAAIDGLLERAGMRRREARPAGARFEFLVVREELLSAARARERPGTLLGEQPAAARPLRRMPAQDRVLLRRQDLLPLFVGLLHWKFVAHAVFRLSVIGYWLSVIGRRTPPT